MSEPLTMTLAEDAPPPVRSATVGFGLSLANWEQAFQIAKVLAKSALVPKQYQGNFEDIVVAMQYGAEIGLPPMAALQSVAVINGRPGVYGDGFLGVIQAAPAYVKHVEYYILPDQSMAASLTPETLADDHTAAVCKFYRRGIAEPFTGVFSIADAKRAKLWNKAGPWQEYPARQLRWRARGFAGRDAFAAELRGIKLAEELIDTPDDTPELLELESPRTIPPPIRRSAKTAGLPVSPDDPSPSGGTPDATVSRAASARPRPPSPSGRAAAPLLDQTQTTTTDALVITSTVYCTPKNETPYYEVRATVKKDGAAPLGYIFRTTDEALYQLAQSAEGSDQPFQITWHVDPRAEGARKILDALAAS